MTQELEIDGETYFVDVEKLKRLKIVQKKIKLHDIKPGDVYKNGSVRILIIQTDDYRGIPHYQMAGLLGLKIFTDYPRPVTANVIVKYLNDEKYDYLGNINQCVDDLIRGL